MVMMMVVGMVGKLKKQERDSNTVRMVGATVGMMKDASVSEELVESD